MIVRIVLRKRHLYHKSGNPWIDVAIIISREK